MLNDPWKGILTSMVMSGNYAIAEEAAKDFTGRVTNVRYDYGMQPRAIVSAIEEIELVNAVHTDTAVKSPAQEIADPDSIEI
jgi:hypothetical protein